jgi:hypothetical protein
MTERAIIAGISKVFRFDRWLHSLENSSHFRPPKPKESLPHYTKPTNVYELAAALILAWAF